MARLNRVAFIAPIIVQLAIFVKALMTAIAAIVPHLQLVAVHHGRLAFGVGEKYVAAVSIEHCVHLFIAKAIGEPL